MRFVWPTQQVLERILFLKKYPHFLALLLCLSSFTLFGQSAPPDNWFNLDYALDGVPGVSTNRAYSDFLNKLEGKPVIVAVLDSGVDIQHEDLQGKIWINADEIPDNGLDDDQNGYIDDVHGWNFLGNKEGESIQFDNLEMTRQYVLLQKEFEEVDKDKLSGAALLRYQRMEDYSAEIEKKKDFYEEEALFYGRLVQAMQQLKEEIGKETITVEDLKSFRSKKSALVRVAAMTRKLMQEGDSFNSIVLDIVDNFEYFYNHYKYYYNPEYDPRNEIGDDYSDPYDKNYGNNDVIGPEFV